MTLQTPADAIAAYLRAKDGNRPHVLADAFTPDATLHITVRRGTISFPPVSHGRDAIADVLVRQFAQNFENVYTFCLCAPPAAGAGTFSCDWLVVMSEKDNRAVRVGFGRYDWQFDPASGLAYALAICIEAMQSLPPESVAEVMHWASHLRYPWCPRDEALRNAPRLDGLAQTLECIGAQPA